MIFIAMFIGMVIVAILTLTVMAYGLLFKRAKIQHTSCHTDRIKPEQSHGHTEPHV